MIDLLKMDVDEALTLLETQDSARNIPILLPFRVGETAKKVLVQAERVAGREGAVIVHPHPMSPFTVEETKFGPVVTNPQEEIRILEVEAAIRQRRGEKSSFDRNEGGHRTNDRVQLDGERGEHAFSKLSGRPMPIFDGRKDPSGDRQQRVLDFSLEDGRSVQVKYNTYPDGWFYVGIADGLKADLGVLAVFKRSTNDDELVRFPGFITRAGFDAGKHPVTMRGKDYLAVVQNLLSPVREIVPQPTARW